MSTTTMFIIGPKKYFIQIRSLIGFKVHKSFYKKYNFPVSSASGHINMKISDTYYFFVNIKSDNRVVIFKSLEKYSSYPTIHYINKIDNDWKFYEFKMSYSSACAFTHILKSLVSKKMEKSMESATLMEDGEIDSFINTQLVQMIRDKRLNTLLK